MNVANVSETNNKWYAEKNDTINNKYGGTFCGSIIKMIDSNIPRPFVARAYATISMKAILTQQLYILMSSERNQSKILQSLFKKVLNTRKMVIMQMKCR